MILGIGNDLCDIKRIEKTLARFGERFERRIFTQGERHKAHSRAHIAGTYAKRFAAKEACAKALGTGLKHSVFWRDIEVINLPSGKPGLRLSGGALTRLQAITPPGMSAHIELSMTDEYPFAQAFVVIWAKAA